MDRSEHMKQYRINKAAEIKKLRDDLEYWKRIAASRLDQIEQLKRNASQQESEQ